MKAILMSIKPKWCTKIFNGEKTVEVRKTVPKLELPFKVYVYCTKEKGGAKIINDCLNSVYVGGKVVGEYVCKNVEKFNVGSLRSDDIEKLGCLSYTELINYFYKPWELDGKTAKQGKAIHISAVKFYDKPKALGEFRKPCKRNYECENPIMCEYLEYDALYDGAFNCSCIRPYITRPPQSWCYVEEIEE